MRYAGLKLSMLVMVCFVCCGAAHAQTEKDMLSLFTEAVNAYHAEQYSKAVDLNEKLLSKGYVSPAVYYNLGNAYLKSGHLGQSMVNYLRADRLMPRDSDLRANLSFARSRVENYKPWPYRSLFALPQKFWSQEEMQWIALILLVGAGTFLLIALYAGLRRKRVMLGTGILGAAAVYLMVAMAFQAVNLSGQAVCIERADARFEPLAQATVYFKIPEGTEVKILREKDGWAKVARSDGKTGWVPVKSVERI